MCVPRMPFGDSFATGAMCWGAPERGIFVPRLEIFCRSRGVWPARERSSHGFRRSNQIFGRCARSSCFAGRTTFQPTS